MEAHFFSSLPCVFRRPSSRFLYPNSLRILEVHLSHCMNSSRNGSSSIFQGSRSYTRSRDKHYDLFGISKPGDEQFKKAWKKEMDEDDCLWTRSERVQNCLEKEIRKVRRQQRSIQIVLMLMTVMNYVVYGLGVTRRRLYAHW